MKPPTRRLGRGLGAFLDFGPADEAGVAHVSDVLFDVDATSVIEVSTPPPPLPPPAPAVVKPTPAKPPVEQTVVAKPTAPPPPPAIPKPVVPTPVPIAVAPKPPEPVADDSPFIDDMVVVLDFPEVELD